MDTRVILETSTSLVRATPENAAKLIDLLNHFGFADAGFKESDFTRPEQLMAFPFSFLVEPP